jgi:hypothetical protein
MNGHASQFALHRYPQSGRASRARHQHIGFAQKSEAGITRQVVSYIRVSTGKQGKSGMGVQAQRDAIARFAANEDCEIAGGFVEVETSKGADARDRDRSEDRRWTGTPAQGKLDHVG